MTITLWEVSYCNYYYAIRGFIHIQALHLLFCFICISLDALEASNDESDLRGEYTVVLCSDFNYYCTV